MDKQQCIKELEENGITPRKYYGQVFTTNEEVIKKFVQVIKDVYKDGTKIVEIGGGLGYITSKLADEFEDVEVVEYDDQMYEVLNTKFNKISNIQLIKGDKSETQNSKIKTQNNTLGFEFETLNLNIIKGDILDYTPPNKDYILVGNIPFHISGRLYRKFMSEIDHKPYAMVFITDKQYATTLMGQPPRCYRVSLQAQTRVGVVRAGEAVHVDVLVAVHRIRRDGTPAVRLLEAVQVREVPARAQPQVVRVLQDEPQLGQLLRLRQCRAQLVRVRELRRLEARPVRQPHDRILDILGEPRHLPAAHRECALVRAVAPHGDRLLRFGIQEVGAPSLGL